MWVSLETVGVTLHVLCAFNVTYLFPNNGWFIGIMEYTVYRIVCIRVTITVINGIAYLHSPSAKAQSYWCNSTVFLVR